MQKYSPLRKSDELAAEAVSQFLEEHFYSKHVTNYQKVTEREEQIRGVDTRFTYNGHNYVCDEKAAVKYVNKPIKTFAFELSYLDGYGNERTGWLLNKKYVNDSFLLVWVDYGKRDNIDSKDDITELTAALVKKQRVVQYLDSLGWNYDNLSRKQCRIRDCKDESFGDIRTDGCRFVYSRRLFEQPINVLVDRETLCEFADLCVTVKV